MAFKFTKAQQKARAELVDRLSAEKTVLEEAVEVYNEAVRQAYGDLREKMDAYNEILADARDFVGEIANGALAEMEEKSERWHEGEKAQSAQSWLDALEGYDPEEVEIEQPDEVDLDDVSHAEDLGDLPDSAED